MVVLKSRLLSIFVHLVHIDEKPIFYLSSPLYSEASFILSTIILWYECMVDATLILLVEQFIN